MKAKEYFKLHIQGISLDRIFYMMIEEAKELVEMRNGVYGEYWTGAYVAAYKDQRNKSVALIRKINNEQSIGIPENSFVDFVFEHQVALAKYVYKDFLPKIQVGDWFDLLDMAIFGTALPKEFRLIVKGKFQSYLNKLNLEQPIIEAIIPKSKTEVIWDIDNPLKKHSFHPALCLHFVNFIEEIKSEMESKIFKH